MSNPALKTFISTTPNPSVIFQSINTDKRSEVKIVVKLKLSPLHAQRQGGNEFKRVLLLNFIIVIKASFLNNLKIIFILFISSKVK